jgi:class I fructose-bisphosphate aldolase
MHITDIVKKIIAQYEGESIALKTNLARLFSTGQLQGTGKMIIFAVDQGFEHGPDKMFAMNSAAYDPHYIYHMAVKYKLNALAAPLGLLQAGAETFLGQVPLILKMNSSSLLMRHHLEAPDQARTASIKDAVRLGCIGVGFTIYPGSEKFLDQLEELKDLAAQARSYGLIVIVWSYVRGYAQKDEETALDQITYGAHMACLMGAHIVKVKIPQDKLHMHDAAQKIAANKLPTRDLTDRIRHVVRGCFTGRRIVIFSGGEIKGDNMLEQEARAILSGGGYGSIVGRNFFQRPEEEAKKIIENLHSIYLKKEI